MKFVADNTPNESRFHHDMEMLDNYISSFSEDAGTVFLADDTENKIEKIIVQKYISSYLQSPFMVYYDYRRTGFPKFKINSSTNLNEGNPEKWPMRWMYEQGEYNQNSKNVLEAVKRQFDGSDDVNQVMWLLKD